MQTDTAYLFGQTIISNGTYTGNPWLNPQYLLSNNGSYAQTNSVTTLGSDVVVGNFLFNIPQDSIISGIEVSITGYRDNAASPATVLDIFAYDNTGGNNFFYQLLPQFSGFSTIATTYYFGSSSYLFNTTWTPDQINNLKIRLQANGALYVAGLQVRVTYTPPGGTSTVTQNVCGSLFQAQPFQLVQPVSTSSFDTVWLVNRFNTADGVPITNADIPSPNGIPITTDQGNDQEENDYVTNVASTAGNQVLLTVTRGWSFRDPITQSAPLRKHGSGAEIVIANSVPFYDVFLRKCHIGSLVSAPIEALDDGTQITPYIRSLNFVGAGVIATGTPNGTGGKDITVTIAGFTTNPPVVNNTTTFTSGGLQVNTLTQQHQVSGTDRFLLVQLTLESTQTVSGVTYNGDALTLVGAQNEGDVRTELWKLTAPDLGTNALIITLSGLSYLSGNIASFTQVDQTTPFTFDGTNSDNTNQSTGSATTTSDNALVVHATGTKLVGISYTAGGGESLISTALTGAVQGAIEVQAVGTTTTVTTNVDFSSVTDWANVIGSINGITPPTPIVSPVEIQDEGITVEPDVAIINFTGAGVTATLTGPNEVEVNVPGGAGTDELVAVSAADTTPGYLQPKLNIHSSDGSVTVTETITNPAGNEVLDIDITAASGVGSPLASTNGTTTKNAADASATQTIAHGLGQIPKEVTIKAISVGSTAGEILFTASAFYNGTTQSSNSNYRDNGVGAISDNTFSINTANATGAYSRGVITFDATNIYIAWTKTGGATGTYQILWEALAGGSGGSLYTVNTDETVSNWWTIQIQAPFTGSAATESFWTVSGTWTQNANGSYNIASTSIYAYASLTNLLNGGVFGTLDFGTTTILKLKNLAILPIGVDVSGGGNYLSSFIGFSESGTADSGDITDVGLRRVGFGTYDGDIYAIVCDNVAITATNLGAYASPVAQLYEIILEGTSTALFYINGSLVATISTNLPTSQPIFLQTAVSNLGGTSEILVNSNFVLSQQIQ